jgi:hypothetical protein
MLAGHFAVRAEAKRKSQQQAELLQYYGQIVVDLSRPESEREEART